MKKLPRWTAKVHSRGLDRRPYPWWRSLCILETYSQVMEKVNTRLTNILDQRQEPYSAVEVKQCLVCARTLWNQVPLQPWRITLRDSMRTRTIWERLGGLSQPWFGHVTRTPPGCVSVEPYQERPSGRRPWGRPKTRGRDYISQLVWECPGILQEKLESVARDEEVGADLLILLPPWPPTRTHERKMNE